MLALLMGLYTIFNLGEVTAAGAVFPVVGAVLVALRISIRRKKMKKLGIEDWLVFPALVYITPIAWAWIPTRGSLGFYDRDGSSNYYW